MTIIQGHLTLIGADFDTSYVTETIGYSAPYIREKDEILGNGRAFGHCEWGVETEQIETDNFVELSMLLMNILPCSEQTLAEVAQICGAQWHILFLVKIYDEFPPIIITPEFTQFAAAISAGIGFDGYVLK